MLNHLPLLPPSSFVRFQGRKLARPAVFWANPALPQAQAILAQSYCLPYPGEPADLYLDENVEMLAERYGGEGVGNNGGGVRCGLIGGFQVKGVGRNPLAGKNAHFWHSHGGNALELALREAVWGEVCQAALPFGAARIVGIVKTDSMIPYLSHKGQRSASRVLVFREPKLRPAHFMRAVFFDPDHECMAREPSDAARTRAAVRAFPAILRQLGLDVGVGPACEPDQAFGVLMRRFARQLAAARARKIMHGGLSSSNLALDGGWLDFDTITSITDYGRVIMGSFDLPDFWEDHIDLFSVIKDLHFYWGKYAAADAAPLAPLPQQLAHFLRELSDAEADEFAQLTGFPEATLEAVGANAQAQLYRTVRRIVASGNRAPFYFSAKHTWRMPEVMGDYSMNAIFRAASRARSAGCLDGLLAPLLGDQALRRQFVAGYLPFWRHYFGGDDAAVHRPRRDFLVVNAWRRNATFHALSRSELDGSIEAVCDSAEQAAALVATLARQASWLLGPARDGIDLEAADLDGGRIDPLSGLSVRGEPTRSANLLGEDYHLIDSVFGTRTT